MIKVKMFVLIGMILFGLQNTMCFAFDNGDFQYHGMIQANHKISDKWKANVTEELYWGDNSRDFYYHHTDIGFAYSGLADWFNLSLNYRRIYSESNGKWKVENRPHINGTVKWKVSGFGLSNRARLEYRDQEALSASWRFRNMVTVVSPLKLTRFEIAPFIADDIFYDLGQGKFSSNEFWAGINFQIAKDVSGGIYYILPSMRVTDSEWKNYNVLTTNISVNI